MACVHAVMFPFPWQGHINPMMQLAQRLILTKGFYITFINTDFNQQRILESMASHNLPELPHLQFCTIPDGLPLHHGRFSQDVEATIAAVDRLAPALENLLKKIVSNASFPPVTCIISDCLASWVQDVAEAAELPLAVLWTAPVHANLAYCATSRLMSEGLAPFVDKQAGSQLVTSIPGLPPFCVCDLLSFFHGPDDSFFFRWVLTHFTERPRRPPWNLGNNVYELEREATDAFRQQVKSFLPIGPLLPESYFTESAPAKRISLWPEDSNCLEWLGTQRPMSVLYISFGSVVHMPERQVEELARGLEASGQPFLWVFRSEVEGEKMAKLKAFEERMEGRGKVVAWAPQLQVLAHGSVGGFLTHCGWNSLMEGMSAGVPILAWPGGFAEQKMNVRYIVEEWGVGMKFPEEEEGVVGREQVEKTIRAFMEALTDKLRKRAAEIREVIHAALQQDGSSQRNLDIFVEAMILRAQCSKVANLLEISIKDDET